MIQRIREGFDHFCFFNTWLVIGMLSVSLKSHPWHRCMPAYGTFYGRYKGDAMINLYVRISNIVLVWVMIFLFLMIFIF